LNEETDHCHHHRDDAGGGLCRMCKQQGQRQQHHADRDAEGDEYTDNHTASGDIVTDGYAAGNKPERKSEHESERKPRYGAIADGFTKRIGSKSITAAQNGKSFGK
jgi:hypothetical protein